MRETYWIHECQKLTQAIEKYAAKEEETVRRHTLETTELRKKISFLSEEVQRREVAPLSAPATSTTFSNSFSDFNPVTMSGSPQWDDFTFVNSSSAMGADLPKSADSALSARQRDVKPHAKEDEPAVTGLLLMLLLCGAWVASSSGSGKPATVPEMPEDVRAASAAVLSNIYKDAGLQPQDSPSATFGNSLPGRPSPSHHPGQVYQQSFDPHAVHQMLTDPSRQQQQDQAFSLTPDQYNHITSDWFSEQTKSTSPPRRRNLADALASLHINKRTTATDAYTKSLLVDQVPANVVRDFHRMVAERNTAQDQNEPLN